MMWCCVFQNEELPSSKVLDAHDVQDLPCTNWYSWYSARGASIVGGRTNQLTQKRRRSSVVHLKGLCTTLLSEMRKSCLHTPPLFGSTRRANSRHRKGRRTTRAATRTLALDPTWMIAPWRRRPPVFRKPVAGDQPPPPRRDLLVLALYTLMSQRSHFSSNNNTTSQKIPCSSAKGVWSVRAADCR
ncbi:hypothetical protein ACA910_018364 [Epithemia clementina (nom. ined.)]